MSKVTCPHFRFQPPPYPPANPTSAARLGYCKPPHFVHNHFTDYHLRYESQNTCVYMCMCVYMCVYMYMHACEYTYIHMYSLRVQSCHRLPPIILKSQHVYVYVMCMYTYMYMHMYIHTCVIVCKCICICIYIYTHV